MEGLTGPAVNLTLCIKEGRGFGFLQNPIVVVARLNYNTLETNVYPPIAEPQFHEELLWETDKQTLRRLRTGKVPVKVECFTLTRQNQRLKVGTVLLDLRTAFIVAKGRSARAAPDSWHKMQCGSGRCPEMLLCLRVEDANSEAHAGGDILEVKSPREHAHTTDGVTPERFTQNQTLIQVGPLMMTTDIFQLTVRVKSSESISTLKNWSDMHFTCNLFGTDSRSDFFNREATGECVVSIRSSLRFLQQYLENNPLLWIRLILGREDLGSAQIDITSLVPTASLAELLEVYVDGDSVIETNRRCLITPSQPASRDTFVDVSLLLKHCQSEVAERNSSTEQARITRIEAAGDQKLNGESLLSSVSTAEDHPRLTAADNQQNQPTADNFQRHLAAENQPRQRITENFPRLPSSDNQLQPPATDNFLWPSAAENQPRQTITGNLPELSNADNNPRLMTTAHESDAVENSKRPSTSSSYSSKCQAPVDAMALTSASDSRLLRPFLGATAPIASEPALGALREFRSFSLHVALQSVQLHQRLPDAQRLRFSLRHPQAQAIADGLGEVDVPAAGVMATLPDVSCRLRFVSTVDEISRLLLAYPPKVSLHCQCAGMWSTLASAALDTARLLAERRRVVFPAPLLDAQGAETGVLYVALDLCDDGVRQERSRRVGPAVLDERIAHEAVEELEEWKERQEDHFNAQLAVKESERLEQLTADFNRRRSELERQLELNLTQAKDMAERLDREAEESTLRSAAQLRAQAALELRGEQLEQRFKAQVQALRDASTRMEDDLMHKAKLIDNKNLELRAVSERLQKENALLKKSLEERDKELFSTNLTQDQTASILQDMRVLEEKLDQAGRSKAYFKEQWLQVARELHQLKTEHHTQMQIQIRNSKQSVQALGFQRLLNKEAEELSSDQQLLQQLKSELTKDFSCEDAQRLNLSASTSRSSANFSEATLIHQQGAEQMLHSLIDERDLLLRTGRFSMNDQAVDKINQQIRSQTNLV